MKTKTPKAKKAMQHFKKLCEPVSKSKSPLNGMTEDEIIEKLRKTREELWEEKMASLSCHEPEHYYRTKTISKAEEREAQRLWNELRENVMKKRSPFEGMTKKEAIDAVHKVREELWEEKIASRH